MMINFAAQKTAPICFRGYNEHTTIKSGASSTSYVHITNFMRDFETLDFTQNYIKEKFPNGTHIAEFGCSQGQKPYSLLVLLDDANKDKKYKITGFDIVQDVVDKAENGLFKLENSAEEKMLFAEPTDLLLSDREITKEKAAREKFFQYFDKVETCHNRPNSLQYIRVNHAKTQNLIDFKVGDIEKIDSILPKEKSGIVIFQNALYHILNRKNEAPLQHLINPQESKPDLPAVQKIFEKIHSILPENGIFVIGNLPHDHIYTKSTEPTTLKYQNNKQIEVFDSSPVHDLLKKTGFEPIFYEGTPGRSSVHLPSVWKKTPLKR